MSAFHNLSAIGRVAYRTAAIAGHHDLSERPQCWRFEPRVDRADRASAPDNFSAFAVVYVVTISAYILLALIWDLG